LPTFGVAPKAQTEGGDERGIDRLRIRSGESANPPENGSSPLRATGTIRPGASVWRRLAAGDPGTEALDIHTTRYTIGGRVWELRFTRLDGTPQRNWQARFVLAGGLLFTGLLGAFLLVVTGRADAVEELVARRTREIENVNVSLRHEVGERSRAELQHQRSEERLAAAQQIAHLGSWELDLSTNRFLWSEEFYRIHGIERRDEVIDFGRFLERVHPEDQRLVDRIFGRALTDHQPFSFRYRIVRPDGSVRTLDARGEVTLDPFQSSAVLMHGTGQDVSELDRAEHLLADRTVELERSNVELERSNAELERFAYVASHDLQEPLRAVASHVQILAEDYQGRLDAEADECIRHAVEGARRMRDLIQDYLAYSRVRISQDPHEPTSSKQALASAIGELTDRIEEAGARVTHDELPEVIADPAQLAELFKDLVANAIKFRRDEPPHIHVSAARADTAWIFSVRDNGIGIDPEHTGRIFRLFQRLHTQDRYPGTGIGLAIAKKIVERHGGRIWVESMPSMGSTFHFTLSVRPAEPGGRIADRKTPATVPPDSRLDSGGYR
jgi:PAS domain S-box-containing protein